MTSKAKEIRKRALTYQEYLKHPDYLDFNCYTVRFRFENDEGWWGRTEVNYFARGKNGHERVRRRWELDYKDVKKELIYVSYV